MRFAVWSSLARHSPRIDWTVSVAENASMSSFAVFDEMREGSMDGFTVYRAEEICEVVL
jgi:hypothetical protein